MKGNLSIASARLTTVAVISLLFFPPGASRVSAGPASEQVKRGQYLVALGGCHDCHTPKVFTDKGMELDESRLLSGHPEGTELAGIDTKLIGPKGWLLLTNDLTAAVGPWGISYAANLTSDKETGIGRWTAEAFVQTMRTGLHWGVGPQLLPPMPWMNLAQATDEDLKAIFAYLQSTKPVRNHVPAPIPFENLAKMH